MSSELTDRIHSAAIRWLPPAVSARVLPRLVRQFREAGVTTVRDAPRRLLIGPVNSAAQGYAWARAAERLPDVAAANLALRSSSDVFGFPADHAVPASAMLTNHRWRQAERKAIHEGFTHVIIESGRHLYDPSESVLQLIDELKQRGIRPALLWHGSDVRVPSAHAAREPDSPFRGELYPDTKVLETITRANHEIIAQTDVPVFIPTLDLLLDLPSATWLPIVVEPEQWARAAARPPRAGRRPVVVHAPSLAGLKGSALISETVARLHDEGVIDYRDVRGLPASEMPALYGQADIMLDQFSLGIYGAAACEAMAGGCVVVSHVSDQVRSATAERTGLALPIVEARAAELDGVLRRLAGDPALIEQHASEGVRFVNEVHDGRRSAQVLDSFLST